jgi:hypothetical protein
MNPSIYGKYGLVAGFLVLSVFWELKMIYYPCRNRSVYICKQSTLNRIMLQVQFKTHTPASRLLWCLYDLHISIFTLVIYWHSAFHGFHENNRLFCNIEKILKMDNIKIKLLTFCSFHWRVPLNLCCSHA